MPNLRWTLDRAAWRARNLVGRPFAGRKADSAKRLWRDKDCGCEYAGEIYAALPADWESIERVLEFGCNWGGNLQYLMERHQAMNAVGIDINERVFELTDRYPRFLGLRGDERLLAAFPSNYFDVVFTVSVLDHIPSRSTVRDVIAQFLRISRYVILLEPYIDGVEGDVSGLIRNRVKPGLPGGHKPFAAHSYLHDYDRMLTELGAEWTKTPRPLHQHSFGPFYHAYRVRRA